MKSRTFPLSFAGLVAALHALCNRPRPRVVEFCNADEIQLSVRLYAAKGGAYLGSETTTATLDMTGTYMAEGVQAIGFAADEILDIPGDVTGDRYILVKNLEAEGGNFIQLGTATGGSFAASVYCKVKAGAAVLLCIPSAGAIYAKADTAAVNVQWKACQV